MFLCGRSASLSLPFVFSHLLDIGQRGLVCAAGGLDSIAVGRVVEEEALKVVPGRRHERIVARGWRGCRRHGFARVLPPFLPPALWGRLYCFQYTDVASAHPV